jgi:carbonic anhydrase/acetyltransferase-like protein (isoleucine patch superfamily)
MGATLLDDSVLEDEVVIGAGALITEKKRIPSRSLVMGVPGKVVRTLSDDELKFLRHSAQEYVQVAGDYIAMNLG